MEKVRCEDIFCWNDKVIKIPSYCAIIEKWIAVFIQEGFVFEGEHCTDCGKVLLLGPSVQEEYGNALMLFKNVHNI